jgi:hypothetical protein
MDSDDSEDEGFQQPVCSLVLCWTWWECFLFGFCCPLIFLRFCLKKSFYKYIQSRKLFTFLFCIHNHIHFWSWRVIIWMINIFCVTTWQLLYIFCQIVHRFNSKVTFQKEKDYSCTFLKCASLSHFVLK